MGVVLTWNVQGRVRSIVEQATALAGRRCDVVALQEVRASALGGWEAALAHLGYPHVAGTLAPPSMVTAAACACDGAATPRILRCAALNGSITRSSWSCPEGLRPLAASTPTTRTLVPLTSMRAPMGFS